MSIRKKGDKLIVEIYLDGKKTYVKPSDHGIPTPLTPRSAKLLERKALEARDARKPGQRDETISSFRGRWMRDFGKSRGESTQAHYMERTRAFADEYGSRPLSSITTDEAIQWANTYPGTVPVIKRLFNDARTAKRCNDNPFTGLAVERGKGREDITVLTPTEVEQLARIAADVHSGQLGLDLQALVMWLAYTCMRPGEAYAARYSLLNGDVYDLRSQFNNRLRRETIPKHGSVGAIYVPEPAQRAVADRPRRLDSDLMFHGQRGGQLHQQAMHRYWSPIRAAFMASLPIGHHLHQRRALDPEDNFQVAELRHAGASYMLNDLGLEPWVIARQLRHSDDGGLVLRLYGHPTRQTAIEKMRRAFTAPQPAEIQSVRERRAKEA